MCFITNPSNQGNTFQHQTVTKNRVLTQFKHNKLNVFIFISTKLAHWKHFHDTKVLCNDHTKHNPNTKITQCKHKHKVKTHLLHKSNMIEQYKTQWHLNNTLAKSVLIMFLFPRILVTSSTTMTSFVPWRWLSEFDSGNFYRCFYTFLCVFQPVQNCDLAKWFDNN